MVHSLKVLKCVSVSDIDTRAEPRETAGNIRCVSTLPLAPLLALGHLLGMG